ncbi:hypothetical protein [Helicobacter sp. 11S02629-2]|uniref:hypothetical protein n=1 Tax=Helicobacter sp. 11S02629-2 TaxID=1476195 RepID=UPI000BA7A04C|nr:hypothetical protein [Helicobacter sp. 11S02629-2]PAF42145.1 hypothetical protein BKH40_08005 [Helicobacter sp. 11S02629-2]
MANLDLQEDSKLPREEELTSKEEASFETLSPSLEEASVNLEASLESLEQEVDSKKPLSQKEEVENFKLENKELLEYLKSNFGIAKMRVLPVQKLEGQKELKLSKVDIESKEDIEAISLDSKFRDTSIEPKRMESKDDSPPWKD